MGALLKLASTYGLNAPELVFYRSLFSLPVVLLWVMKRKISQPCARTIHCRMSGAVRWPVVDGADLQA
jgi:hypothetical protein